MKLSMPNRFGLKKRLRRPLLSGFTDACLSFIERLQYCADPVCSISGSEHFGDHCHQQDLGAEKNRTDQQIHLSNLSSASNPFAVAPKRLLARRDAYAQRRPNTKLAQPELNEQSAVYAVVSTTISNRLYGDGTVDIRPLFPLAALNGRFVCSAASPARRHVVADTAANMHSTANPISITSPARNDVRVMYLTALHLHSCLINKLLCAFRMKLQATANAGNLRGSSPQKTHLRGVMI